ncbi:MAG: polyprenyl synthetase family protein [Gammaproteobacteria bacterium]
METTSEQAEGRLTRFETETENMRRRIERRLDALVADRAESPHQLQQAMRYSLLAGGKRIRPVVTLMTAVHLGGQEHLALDPACAIEMVHTASLILDDLPCMDDATLRRGQPANHRVFGVDTAILAAMALLNRAYAVISSVHEISPELRLKLIDLLAGAVGSDGIIAGQIRDLRQDLRWQDAESLERMHGQKTGALFVAAAETGARLAGIPEQGLEPIRDFARNLGLAFQTLDDLLDTSSMASAAGKDVGKDCGKATFVSFMGEGRARLMVSRLIEAAVNALGPLAPASEPLAQLAYSLCALPGPAGIPRRAVIVRSNP